MASPAVDLMPPRLRQRGAPDPEYGLCPNKFGVEIHHGGLFCGLGGNRDYIDEKVDYFDECDKETWCQEAIDYMLNQLGYPASWLEHVYWLETGYGITDGLRELIWERDAQKMAAAVSVHCKKLTVYVDHVDLLSSHELIDDVLEAKLPELPSVIISPVKKNRRRGEANGEEQEIADTDTDVEVKRADSDINDSDYQFSEGKEESDSDGDDDDYEKNVDADVENEQLGKKEAVQVWPDDGATDEAYLQSLCAENEVLRSYKPVIFNPNSDMADPIFKMGMAFSTMKEVRDAVAQYAIKNRWEKYIVKEFVGQHDCERVWNVKELTYVYLANKFIEFFRDNESVSIKAFGKHVQSQLNMLPTRFKLSKAKYAALEIIHGDEKLQYNSLWDYGEELRTRNPGTSFYLRTVGNPGIFSTCYFSLDACKRGFLKGCRPVICLDGTHIKNKYGGQLLTAVAIDGNDAIFPIAMAVVEVECYSSWKWFLTTLKDDLNIINTSPFTIMSDKQKGLIKAVMEVWVDSEHRFCVRHLWSNLNQHGWTGETLKNHLWRCARSTTVPQWESNMEKLKIDCPAAHAFLEQLPLNTWCRAFFSDFSKCDLLLNNACEVWNKMILDARELCVLSMWEQISHVISCLRHERMRPDLMVASCYQLETYVQAYSYNIYPISDKSEWTKTNGPDILPPYYDKKVGRSKWSRRKNPEELADGTKLSKHGVKMHCGYCRDPNHTKRNCGKYKADVAREQGVEEEDEVVQQPTTGQDEEVQQPATGQDEEVQQPATGQDEELQHPSVGEDEVVHQQGRKRTRKEQDHVEAADQPKKARRTRKPSLKVREQQEAAKAYEKLRKKSTTFDENGDIDDPSILAGKQQLPLPQEEEEVLQEEEEVLQEEEGAEQEEVEAKAAKKEEQMQQKVHHTAVG
ncbi:hypothetical protein QYE76_054323 [Lolium multiflorum]|uniref:Uncharacterized protein n=1 Tax=Lolium multiflorum TaxID=4521 RepID=A0AAD8SYL3_LOLMU|nr:hypothetical protein QYE76_054323 [Lolium multiflorum]